MMNSTLSNGNFAESSFVRANLNNTTWVDGKKCKLGSIDSCNN